MSDDDKTKEQLLAELEILKKKLEESDRDRAAASSTPVSSAPLTRRALSAWVAPVILSLPVLGTILKPGEVQAQAQTSGYYGGDDQPPVVSLPTMTPTRAPTAAPTNGTRAPTKAGRCVPVPTASPTLGMAAAPDCRPGPAGLLALGAARALVPALR